MTTLVTCATGFVSLGFVRALEAMREPTTVLIRNGAQAASFPHERVVIGDTFDPKCVQVAMEDANTVVHVPPLAYPRGDNESQLLAHRHAHVESTRTVLDQATSCRIKNFLLVSSAQATGRSSDQILCESTSQAPDTAYAQAKLEAEELALDYADRHSINVLILRPTEIYGRGDKSILSPLYKAARRNMWLPIKRVREHRSFVYVDDLARAGLALLGTKLGTDRKRTFIVTDSVDYRPEELYAAVCRSLGKRPMMFGAPTAALKLAGQVGSSCQALPKLKALALFQQMTTTQSYCGHLFKDTVPGFRFTSLDDALSERLQARKDD